MTSTTSLNIAPHDIVASPRATPHQPPPQEQPEPGVDSIRLPVHLDRGDMLRIHDGQGTRLIPASGVLWVTEEESANDTVLLRGDSHRIGNAGTALALAHRPTRVVLELPAGTEPPDSVDVVFAGGDPGPQIPFGTRKPFSIGAIAAAIGAAIRSAIDAGAALWARIDAPLPSGGYEHGRAFLSWQARHSRRGLKTPPWDEVGRNPRDSMSRNYPYPYY